MLFRSLVGNVEVRSRRGGNDLYPGGDSLDPAEQRPDERPLDVGSQSDDRARVPAVGPPVDRHDRRGGIVGMIDVAASVSGEGDLLSHRREPPKVPFGADEGTLRVLAFDAQDREAVRLDLQLAAEDGRGEVEPGIDRRERDRDLLLDVVDSKPLECPARSEERRVGKECRL